MLFLKVWLNLDMRRYLALLFIGLAFWSCEQKDEEDIIPPTVTISSHTSGSVVSGLVKIIVNTSDEEGISKVEFYINNSLVFTDLEEPYEYEWNTNDYNDNSDHDIKVLSFDNMNNSAEVNIILVVERMKFVRLFGDNEDNVGNSVQQTLSLIHI